MKTILVVCTANICRSPMVAGLLRDRLDRAGFGDQVEVSSAGVYGMEGSPASQYGIELLDERGVEFGDHVARALQLSDISAATLIIVMEENHRMSIFHYAPGSLHKVFLLSELAGENDDLHDPYGRNKDAYRDTLAIIDRYLDDGWPTLLKKLKLPESA